MTFFQDTLPGIGQLIPLLVQFFSDKPSSAFVVGGYLRDCLLSRPPSSDLDLAVNGDAQAVSRQLADHLSANFVAVNPQRGVFRVTSAGSSHELKSGLLTAWSIDLKGFPGEITEDLASRDFTIDAMALPLDELLNDTWAESIVDPFNGQRDLVGKCIQAVASGVFEEDPARLLRSVRLASQLGFRLDPNTATLVRKHAALVERTSGERLRDEFLNILSLDGARVHLEVLDRLDLLCRVIPELALTKGVDQPQVHYWDVWGHTMHCVEEAEFVTKGHRNSPVYMFVPWTPESEAHFSKEAADGHTRATLLKLAALFHDIAKPQTKTVEPNGEIDGEPKFRTRFFGHSELGASTAEERLAQLRMSSRGIGLISKMVEHHLRPNNISDGNELPTARAVHRYYRDVGEAAVDTVYLAIADYLATNGPSLSLEHWSDHARMMGHILQVGTQQPVPKGPNRLLNGHDLMKHLGVEPGPLIGQLLETVIEAQAAGEIKTWEEALALARESLPSQCRRE